MAQYQLPNDFFFGAAMSGPQTEGQWNQGGKLENLWDTWSIQDLGSFYNRVGSYAGNDFMAKYQEVVSRVVPRLSRSRLGAVCQLVPL